MARKNGPWTIQNTTKKYHNDFIELLEDQVLHPDGQPGHYATLRMKPGVAILALDGGRNAYLVRQFRYAVGEESLEVVTGGVNEEEPRLEAAQRELREETGIEASDWQDLGSIYLDTSVVHCPVRLFLARNLTFSEAEREGTEVMKTVKMIFAEAVRLVHEGAIKHAVSCVLILRARDLVEG